MHHNNYRESCSHHSAPHHGHHQTHNAPYYEACQPGLTSLIGGMISVGNAIIWGGAHMARAVVSDALWGNCSCGSSHHGGHHGGHGCTTHHFTYEHHCTPAHHENHCC